MHSRHISDRVHTLPSYTRDMYVGKHVMSVQQLMLPKGKAEGRLLHPALSGSICSPKLPLLCMPFSYRCRDATSVFRATQSHRVRAADRVRRAPIASCRTWRRMACLALRGTGRVTTRAGSLLRRVRGLQATIALASWRYPRRGCMQLMILAPMEGGECRPVPSIEAACIAIHQHVNQIFPTRTLCALVAWWQLQEADAPPPAGRFPSTSQRCVPLQVNMKACQNRPSSKQECGHRRLAVQLPEQTHAGGERTNEILYTIRRALRLQWICQVCDSFTMALAIVSR